MRGRKNKRERKENDREKKKNKRERQKVWGKEITGKMFLCEWRIRGRESE